jgi:hypothetical protein
MLKIWCLLTAGYLLGELALSHPEVDAQVSHQSRDSVGIVIAEHHDFTDAVLAVRLSSALRLQLGAIDAPTAEVFGRVIGAFELSDGTIVVGDGQALQIRAFDQAGRHLWTAGGPGGGPGEFESLRSLWPFPGDSILAVGRLKAQVFSSDGRYGREWPIRPLNQATGVPFIEGVLADGMVVARASLLGVDNGSGLQRPPVVHYVMDRNGQLLWGLGTFPGSDMLLGAMELPGPDGRMIEASTVQPVRMARETLVTAAGNIVVVADQAHFQLRVFSPTSSLLAVISADVPLVSPNRALYQGRPEDPLPPTLPAFGAILLDATGSRLWVQGYFPDYDDRIPKWWIFGLTGELLGQAELPKGFRPSQIAGETVIGIYADELGVEYVEKRTLTPAAR